MASNNLEGGETATLILDTAERLVAVRGFNGFSYSDAATELGMTRAALHYHFASKADLGEALIARYSARFAEALGAVDARESGALSKLEAYAGIYLDVLRDGRMCLCGMLAAERETLPPAMQDAVNRFFKENQRWLSHVLAQEDRSAIVLRGSLEETAWMIINTLEGAMLVARVFNDVSILQSSAEQLLAGLKPGNRVDA
jgi:TetR/AcrR family transcriptional repressor of nem operon